jgi:hypothetical protein
MYYCSILQHNAAHRRATPLSAAQWPECCDLQHAAASAGYRPAHHRPGRCAHGNGSGCINWPRATGTARRDKVAPYPIASIPCIHLLSARVASPLIGSAPMQLLTVAGARYRLRSPRARACPTRSPLTRSPDQSARSPIAGP